MNTPREIDVQSFMSAQKLSRMQVTVLLLCFCVVAVDGFDTASIAFIAPALRAEWQLTTGHLSVLFGAGMARPISGAPLVGTPPALFVPKTIPLLHTPF